MSPEFALNPALWARFAWETSTVAEILRWLIPCSFTTFLPAFFLLTCVAFGCVICQIDSVYADFEEAFSESEKWVVLADCPIFQLDVSWLASVKLPTIVGLLGLDIVMEKLDDTLRGVQKRTQELKDAINAQKSIVDGLRFKVADLIASNESLTLVAASQRSTIDTLRSEVTDLHSRTRELALAAASREKGFDIRIRELTSVAALREEETESQIRGLASAAVSREEVFESRIRELTLGAAAREEAIESRIQELASAAVSREKEFESQIQELTLSAASREAALDSRLRELAAAGASCKEKLESRIRELTLSAASREEETDSRLQELAIARASREAELESQIRDLTSSAAAREEATDSRLRELAAAVASREEEMKDLQAVQEVREGALKDQLRSADEELNQLREENEIVASGNYYLAADLERLDIRLAAAEASATAVAAHTLLSLPSPLPSPILPLPAALPPIVTSDGDTRTDDSELVGGNPTKPLVRLRSTCLLHGPKHNYYKCWTLRPHLRSQEILLSRPETVADLLARHGPGFLFDNGSSTERFTPEVMNSRPLSTFVNPVVEEAEYDAGSEGEPSV